MKRFENINPDHIQGLSWWFYIRENFSFMNAALCDLLVDYWGDRYFGMTSFVSVITFFPGIPAGYILGIFIGPKFRKTDLEDCAYKEYDVMLYNKHSINYFTLLEMLSGKTE